jgi:hypothetical protein
MSGDFSSKKFEMELTMAISLSPTGGTGRT